MNAPLNLLFSAFAFAAGAAAATQGAANAGLSARIGLGPALIVNTTVVLAFTVALHLLRSAMGHGADRGFFPPGTPWILYVGGACGFVIIASLAFVFPKIGAAYAVALMVLGQGVAALAIDHFGWLEMPSSPTTLARVAGLALVAAGAALLRA